MDEVTFSIFLSIVQGITEFLPISSSGHLVLFENLLPFKSPNQNSHLLNVVLHFGTMFATVIVFRADIYNILRAPFIWYKQRNEAGKNMFNEGQEHSEGMWWVVVIVVGSIPTGLIGFFLRDYFMILGHDNLFYVGIMFFITGIFLYATKYTDNLFPEGSRSRLRLREAFLIGVMQGLSIAPGISRSGITISTGLLVGLKRETMIKYSFLLSLPAIFVATLYESLKFGFEDINILSLGVGFMGAFIFGYLSLKLLIRFVRGGKLSSFAYYCFFIGFLLIILV